MNISAIKQAFETKYDEHIRTISKEKDVDMGVARDILIAHARNRNKTVEELSNPSYYYNFEGCENLNYAVLDEDIKVLEDNFIVPKAM
jgi:uncharacterized protein (DUF427 family)